MKTAKAILVNLEKKIKYSHCKKINREKTKKYFAKNKFSSIDKDFLESIQKRWKPYGIKIDPLRLQVYININGNYDINYIHEETYKYLIEPILSPNRYSSTIYQNKSMIDLLAHVFPEIPKALFPKNIIRSIEGVNYDVNFQRLLNIDFLKFTDDKLVFKKSLDTGGGRDVFIFHKKGDCYFTKDGRSIFDTIKNNVNFIVQEYINQHESLKILNATSLNTIRIITLRRMNEEIVVLHSFLKIGEPGNEIDNQGLNSGFIYVNSDGTLDNTFLMRNGEILQSKFSATTMLKFDDIIKHAKTIASRFYFHRIIGFDFSLDDKGMVKLIEINPHGLNPEVSNMLKGSIFDKYTDEVMEYVYNKLSSY